MPTRKYLLYICGLILAATSPLFGYDCMSRVAYSASIIFSSQPCDLLVRVTADDGYN